MVEKQSRSEPVAVLRYIRDKQTETYVVQWTHGLPPDGTELYTHPPTEPQDEEPAGWLNKQGQYTEFWSDKGRADWQIDDWIAHKLPCSQHSLFPYPPKTPDTLEVAVREAGDIITALDRFAKSHTAHYEATGLSTMVSCWFAAIAKIDKLRDDWSVA